MEECWDIGWRSQKKLDAEGGLGLQRQTSGLLLGHKSGPNHPWLGLLGEGDT